MGNTCGYFHVIPNKDHIFDECLFDTHPIVCGSYASAFSLLVDSRWPLVLFSVLAAWQMMIIELKKSSKRPVSGSVNSAVRSLTSAESATAAAIRESIAEMAQIQRKQPGQLPTQIVNSADLRELPARHFGRKFAFCEF